MKIRSGFVSNSSSSSFILVFDEKKFKRCSKCGHTPTSPLSLIEDADDCDTEVNWTDIQTKIAELVDAVDELIRENEQYKNGTKTYSYQQYTSTDCIRWNEGSISEKRKEITRLKDLKKKYPKHTIVGVEVSYHNDYLNNLLTEMVNNKDLLRLDAYED